MPNRQQYRAALAMESGPYVGLDQYDVRAMGGSTTLELHSHVYPIQSGIPQQDMYIDRPLHRPNAVRSGDRDRYVADYQPADGILVPDLEWTESPLADETATTYLDLEAHTYGDLEAYTYEFLEGVDITGPGERFEILGPFDAPTMHQLINDGLKQCWLVVEVTCIPTTGATRHNLNLVCPWLQDTGDMLQVGVLYEGENRNTIDPFDRRVYGTIERDGGDLYLNTDTTTYNDNSLLVLRCLKRAYDHCRPSGGFYGQQAGLSLETDEAPVELDWLVSSSLVIAWRRFAHILDPEANQRIIRDQATAAAWFSDNCRKHFTEPLPQKLLKPRRHFGPSMAMAGFR